ncbi:glutathione hydrolase proenzyme 1 [Caerostris extrusa]|uniref:Glutathione hydrolase proenzyme 1 n=1 Tax=Caerostris extrusa TaxID=172846 RepID=A0AAV4WXZ7_CAEEX|nr:glutathione hydrolase proenzyme 1 [Caerostris extrusa]
MSFEGAIVRFNVHDKIFNERLQMSCASISVCFGGYRHSPYFIIATLFVVHYKNDFYRIHIHILKMGGNAADAAIATMAAVSVIEPLACGIGGDCHCTFYSHKDKTVLSINGSGRTGKLSTLDKIRAAGITDPVSRDCFNHGLWVSVPGTVAGMAKVVEKFGSGKLSLKQILDPAVRLAEEGVPIPYKHAFMWDTYQDNFRHSKNAQDLLINGRAPAPGDILYAPKLAKVLRDIGDAGIESFYSGTRAQNIAVAVQENGGALTAEDLKDHLENPPNPLPAEALSVNFHGFRIWEMKPNTMGIVALVAFNTLKAYDLKGKPRFMFCDQLELNATISCDSNLI